MWEFQANTNCQKQECGKKRNNIQLKKDSNLYWKPRIPCLYKSTHKEEEKLGSSYNTYVYINKFCWLHSLTQWASSVCDIGQKATTLHLLQGGFERALCPPNLLLYHPQDSYNSINEPFSKCHSTIYGPWPPRQQVCGIPQHHQSERTLQNLILHNQIYSWH